MNLPQKTARVAAFVFLGIFLLGMFTELFIRPGMIVPGDAAATVQNIRASEALFRLSLVSDLVRLVLLMVLPLVLYRLLKPVNKNIASLMVIFALVSVPISMLNELNHFAVLLLSSGAGYFTAFKADQLNALVMFFLELRKYGTFIPQALSVWILLLGYLVFKSGFLPRILGILLMLAGFCYTVLAVLFFLFPNLDLTIPGLLAFIGESLFYLWLLIKGVNVPVTDVEKPLPNEIHATLVNFGDGNAVTAYRTLTKTRDPEMNDNEITKTGGRMMDLKIIIIIAVSYLYGFFEVFMNLRQRRKSNVTTSRDKGSLWLLYCLITIGYALSFSIGATKTGRIYHWNTFFALGMTLFVIGLVIRIHSILTLKQFFTYSIAKVESHKIVETGLYKFIRHPGYLGQLIIFIGISVSISNWLSILVMMIPVSLGFLYRIKVEEKFMIDQLGEDYKNYQERTKRIIPMLY